MNRKLPHPIPYQGSKRKLAPTIFGFFPRKIEAFYEPFSGSAAMTIYAASQSSAKRYILGDTLEPIIDLWSSIINNPERASFKYENVWLGQSGENEQYFNKIRDRYNKHRDDIDLLYLVCRCVKNSVRFGSDGRFTQSHDKRRLGMDPRKMRSAIFEASSILKGKTELRKGDWRLTTADARTNDFIYLDPPYMGTTLGRDKRYHQQLLPDQLISGLEDFNERDISFVLSYDGMTGDREYGPQLPSGLSMSRLLLNAGRSAQATLQGKKEETVESLYLSRRICSAAEKNYANTHQPALFS